MKKLTFVLMLMATFPAWSQHSFYVQLLTDGESAMERENWAQAARYLEIAAFGLLEHPEQLVGAYMRLALVAEKMEDAEKVAFYTDKIRHLQKGAPTQPSGLSDRDWNAYQVLVGLKEKPAPPVPSSEQALADYVKKYPSSEKAWLALLKLRSEGSLGKARETADSARKALPNSVPILRQVLLFRMVKDKGQDAESLAQRLLSLDPEEPVALEVLGNLAILAKDYPTAKSYHSRVPKPLLSETRGLLQKMNDALDREKRDADSAQKQKAKDAAAAEQARVSKAKREAQERADSAARVQATKQETERRSDAEEARAVKAKPKTEPKAEPKVKPELSAKSEPKAKVKPKSEPKAKPPIKLDPLEEAEKAVLANDSDLTAKYALLGIYLDRRLIKKATPLLEKIAKADPRHPDYPAALARYYYVDNNYVGCTEALAKKWRTLDQQARYYLGLSYYKLDDLTSAEKVLEGLDRKTFPELGEVDRKIKAESKRRGAGVETPSTAPAATTAEVPVRGSAPSATATEDPWTGPLSAQLPLFARYLDEGRWQEVVDPLKKAFRAQPNNPEVAFLRARLYLAEGDSSRALVHFEDLAREGFQKGDSLYFAGLAAQKGGDADHAEQFFRRARNEGSRYQEAINRQLSSEKKTSTGLRTGSNGEMRALIQELEKISTQHDYISTRFALLRLYAISDRQADFKRLRTELAKRKLSSKDASLLQAWTYCSLGKYREATTALAGLTDVEAVFLRAYLLLAQGDSQKSKTLLLSLDPREFPEVDLLLSL